MDMLIPFSTGDIRVGFAGDDSEGGGPSISSVFVANPYTGAGVAQDITLPFSPDLAWVKQLDTTNDHILVDTDRGAGWVLSTNLTAGSTANADTVEAFLADGITVGLDWKVNRSGRPYGLLAFKKQAGFFDIVQDVGDGVAGNLVPHNLGEKPGMVIRKELNAGSNAFLVYHKDAYSAFDGDSVLDLGTSSPLNTTSAYLNDTPPTATDIVVGSAGNINGSGDDYINYIFAHNPDNGIFCGSYTGTGATGNAISLPWEPQFIMTKKVSGFGNWYMWDTSRGLGAGADMSLFPSLDIAELDQGNLLSLSGSGFTWETGHTDWNGTGVDYIFLAIKAA